MKKYYNGWFFMEHLIPLLFISAAAVYLVYYFLAKSLLQILFGPLVAHVKDTEFERYTVKGFENHKLRDIDFVRIPRERVKITVRHVDRPLHLSKSLLEKAKTTPQKLFHTRLWIYRDYIFAARPTEEKMDALFGD